MPTQQMNKIVVKYSNELNYMPMPKLKGTQQDLFFSILSQIKDKHDSTNPNIIQKFFNPETRKLVIPYKEFVDICRIDHWNKGFTEVYNEIKDFLDILTSYKIEYSTKNDYYVFVCFEEAKHDIKYQTINITFQKRFYEMVVNYKLGFTRFELIEFISLSGKYTKTLYRMLKQYRSTGYMRMDWDDFTRIIDIPSTYKMCDIEKQILKPAIAELTQERTLFDQSRIPFKNLQYTKLKGKGRGRGGNVVGIEFTFKPEKEPRLKSAVTPPQYEKYIHQYFWHKTADNRFYYIKKIIQREENKLELIIYNADDKKDRQLTIQEESFKKIIVENLYR